MKRKTVSVMLALGMALSLTAGCGGQSGETEPGGSSVGAESGSVESGSSQGKLRRQKQEQRRKIRAEPPDPTGKLPPPASEIQLTEEEKQQIRDGGYTAAISLALWRKRLGLLTAGGASGYL